MEMRQEQQTRQRAAPHLRKQQTMQTRPSQNQSQYERIAERLESAAIIQERVMARLDTLERWRDERDRERERQEERKDDRIEKAPDNKRADYALAVSVSMALIYLLQLLALHWK